MEDIHVVPAHVQNPGTLVSLPVEVLSRILIYYVDGSDIPALQQTCKTLRSAIMTRQFWYNRIHRLCKEYAVFLPEEELEEYTIAELEQWTLRRIHARNTSPVKLQLHSRNSPMLGFYGDVFLVPGGRWLLIRYGGLRVYFTDLDSSNLDHHLLLDPNNDNARINRCILLGYCIWINHKAPRLSFLFEATAIDGGSDMELARVYIYQVDLMGHGVGATLVAQIIATFQTPRKNIWRFKHALNNRYFIRNHGWDSCAVPGVEVVEYSQAMGCLDYPLMDSHTLLSEVYVNHLEFIHEDVLAVYCEVTCSYQIYNIESSTSSKLLHKIKIDSDSLDFSRIRWTPNASLITFIEGQHHETKTLHALVMPHDSRFHPWTVEIGNLRLVGQNYENIQQSLGIFTSRLWNKTDKFSHFGYKWDYTCESSTRSGPTDISILEQDVDQLGILIAFDEDIGRSLHSVDRGLNVVDVVRAG